MPPNNDTQYSILLFAFHLKGTIDFFSFYLFTCLESGGSMVPKNP